jgi:peptidoglycan/LPS O-acetylase OafA/YrhL
MFHFTLSHVASLSKPDFTQILLHRFSANGAYGVSMFFVVSGFLITRLIASQPKGLLRPDLKNFYSRRVGRIFPLLLLVVLLGVGIMLLTPIAPSHMGFCLKNPNASFEPSFWVSILLFVFNWYRGFVIPGGQDFGIHWDVLWSLSIEEQFYLFYPLILKRLGTVRNLFWLLLIFIVVGPLVSVVGVFFYPNQNHWPINSFSNFNLIAMGCLLALICDRYKNQFEKNKIGCAFFTIAGVFILVRTFFAGHTELDYSNRIWSPFAIGAGTFLLLLGGLHLKFFQSKWLAPFALPGKLSYGGYLLHASVLYFLWPLLTKTSEWEAFLLFFSVTVMVAWISYRFFEMPANLFIRKIFAGRQIRKVIVHK